MAGYGLTSILTSYLYTYLCRYDLFNEPWPGMVHEDPTLLEPGRADRDVLGPFYARAAAVSQSVSFTQPLAWGIGSLGRVHHPMKGCSCHRVMKVIRRYDTEAIIFFQPATFPDTLPFASGPVVSAVGFPKDPVARCRRDVAEMPP